MQKIVFILIVFTLCLSDNAAAAKYELRLAHTGDAKFEYGIAADKFADEIAKKTNGEVIISVFPNGQLGNARETFEGLSYGTVDMNINSIAVMSNFVPDMGVFELPFIYRDLNHAYKAFDTLGMEIAKQAEARGVKTLAIWENGIRHITNNKRSIRTSEDMKGLKLRVPETPISIAMVQSLGASPTPMAFQELYTSLQKGVVDGQENPASQIYAGRLFEVQKYMSLTAHIIAGEPLLVSLKTWAKLPENYRVIIEKTARELGVWQRELCRKENANFIKMIADSGKTVINDDVDREDFKNKTRASWDVFVKANKNGKDLIGKVLAIQ